MAFRCSKTRACLKQLDDEAQALNEVPFSIGHVAVGCALGYLDYRFGALNWPRIAPRLATTRSSFPLPPITSIDPLHKENT